MTNYRKHVQEGFEKTSRNATTTYFLQSDFSCGEIVRAYHVNKKYSFNATICRIESGNTVAVRWHEEGSDNITKGLPISRLHEIIKEL